MKALIHYINLRRFQLLRTIYGFSLKNPVFHMRDIKMLYYIYSIYKYLVFFPLLAFSSFFFTALSLLFLPFRSERLIQISGILWARWNAFITPMFVTLKGEEHVDKKSSYVVVANHQSQFDIFAIYGWLPVDFRWVMKAELKKVPFIGYYCEKAGHILIDRTDSKSAQASINDAKSRIKDGTSIFFFPEGTISNEPDLLPFKKGAFKFAIDMGLPILPVSIINTENILPKQSLALFPGKAKVIVHDPIDISNFNDETIDILIKRTRNTIKAGLKDQEWD